jgi:hypothetical protein
MHYQVYLNPNLIFNRWELHDLFMQRSQRAYRATRKLCDGINENVDEILVFVVVISPLWSSRRIYRF